MKYFLRRVSMIKRVYCGKKTKIYIPKIENPKIITCCRVLKEPQIAQNAVMSTGEIDEGNTKRH